MILHGLEGDAVLFDCDGVLVDSEPLSFLAWSKTLAGHGLDLGEQAFAELIGSTEQLVAETYGPAVGVDPVTLELEARSAFEEVAGEVCGFADAIALVERLQQERVPVGVATNGLRWRLDALLTAVGLGRLRSVSVASDEVPMAKPSPDLYRAAASIIGIEPSRCVVVEDSPTGIVAAAAAGCRVLAVDRGAFDRSRLAVADVVVAEL